MICKITNFLRIFFNRKKIRKIRKILRMKKIVKFEFSIYDLTVIVISCLFCYRRLMCRGLHFNLSLAALLIILLVID